MKTYEKYLLTEKTTLTKKLKSIKKTIIDVATPLEYKMAVKSVIAFLKNYRDDFPDDLSHELNAMLDKVQKKVGA